MFWTTFLHVFLRKCWVGEKKKSWLCKMNSAPFVLRWFPFIFPLSFFYQVKHVPKFFRIIHLCCLPICLSIPLLCVSLFQVTHLFHGTLVTRWCSPLQIMDIVDLHKELGNLGTKDFFQYFWTENAKSLRENVLDINSELLCYWEKLVLD